MLLAQHESSVEVALLYLDLGDTENSLTNTHTVFGNSTLHKHLILPAVAVFEHEWTADTDASVLVLLA